MLFDFEQFSRRAKLAYRRVENSTDMKTFPYSLMEVLSIFHYYFETYEYMEGKTHPMISGEQIERIIESMPFLYEQEYDRWFDVHPDEYMNMIDRHFENNYKGRCDYNINHFFSGNVRYFRYNESC